MAASGARVTVITPDGLVLADSQSDPRTMENHAGSTQIREALAQGEGQSTRHSVTINRDLLYYAVKQSVGAESPLVLRFAIPLATVEELLGSFRRSLWLASFVILLLAGTASLLVSLGLSKRIERLEEFSRRVAEGEFPPLPRDASGDALAKLAAPLDQTAAPLARTIR